MIKEDFYFFSTKKQQQRPIYIIILVLGTIAVTIDYNTPGFGILGGVGVIAVFFALFGKKWILEWHRTIVYVSVFYLAFVTLFAEGYQIPSGSMMPTLHGDIWLGDRIFASKAISTFSPLKRGDIVIFIAIDDPKKFVVKRLVGLPGDTIQIKDPYVYINGERLEDPPIFKQIRYLDTDAFGRKYRWATEHPLVVPKDCYFVMGDNSGNSRDSRVWGWLPKRQVLGKAILIWFPVKHATVLE